MTLVADASAIINLNATRRAPEILRCLHRTIIVSSNAVAELQRGAEYGHRDDVRLGELIDLGLVSEMAPSGQGQVLYESLIVGTTATTLDDGEAATIGLAIQIGAGALIDERKARALGAREFPSLSIVSTAELLLEPSLENELGEASRAQAIFHALRDARMRVPHQYLLEVVRVIGCGRAAWCPSLPQRLRQRIN